MMRHSCGFWTNQLCEVPIPKVWAYFRMSHVVLFLLEIYAWGCRHESAVFDLIQFSENLKNGISCRPHDMTLARRICNSGGLCNGKCDSYVLCQLIAECCIHYVTGDDPFGLLCDVSLKINRIRCDFHHMVTWRGSHVKAMLTFVSFRIDISPSSQHWWWGCHHGDSGHCRPGEIFYLCNDNRSIACAVASWTSWSVCWYNLYGGAVKDTWQFNPSVC